MNRAFLGAALAAMLPTFASAQYSDELADLARRETVESFAAELKVGAYSLSDNSSFFAGDRGPLVQLEIDYFALRIPYVGLIGGGIALGWARYDANACADSSCNQRLDEEVKLTAFPIAPMAVLRVDVLPRELGVPIVLSGKIGLDIFVYDVSGGSGGGGTTFGLRWGAQAALELDFINPRRARALDEEWGINHTYLFVEFFGSSAQLASRFAWTIGLGLTF